MQELRSGSENLLGLVEQLTPFHVSGWAFQKSNTRLAPDLALWIDGGAVSWFRPQVRWPKMAQRLKIQPEQLGPVAFDCPLPAWVADGRRHVVEVRCARTGQVLRSNVAAEVCFVDPHVPWSRFDGSAVARRDTKVGRSNHVQSQVTVVVLNRNGAGVMHALLESWVRYNQAVAVEWLVIDHASTDDSLTMLAGWTERLKLTVLALKENFSFSASCNRGAALAKTPYVLFLNNDLVWQHDALPQMLKTLDDPNVGAVGMKLVKLAEGQGAAASMEVQHLGVRFVQQQDGYWPYEVTPYDGNPEEAFSAQTVPAVTGAALLCRKADFEAAGGFDPAYFYGFEDVEFCLRMWTRLGLKSVCRNDLVALHRHGHTRLTGREMEVTDRLEKNAAVLARHLGLWVKLEWWRSLARGDRWLCNEPLRVGWVMSDGLPSSGEVASAGVEFQRMRKAVRRIVERWPHAEVVVVHTGVNPMWARGLHVLVVSDPEHDIRCLEQPRPDLRLVAWINDRPKAWIVQPWWMEFDSYVAATAGVKKVLHSLSPVRVYSGLTEPDLWGPRVLPDGDGVLAWRVHIRFLEQGNTRQSEEGFNCAELAEAAEHLQLSLKMQGVACLLPCQSEWRDVGHGLAAESRSQRKSAEVHVWVLGPGFSFLDGELSSACVNVVWWPSGMPAGFTWSSEVRPDWETNVMPDVESLQTVLEERVGRTFFTP